MKEVELDVSPEHLEVLVTKGGDIHWAGVGAISGFNAKFPNHRPPLF